jgi:uncharacterized lipoprotein YmbA
MITHPSRITIRLLFRLIALIFLLTGCSRTTPVVWYQLTAADSAKANVSSATTGQLRLGLGPLYLPEVLQRPQLVTRTGNRVEIADNHRWAEPLEENITRVLREYLADLLGTEQIITYPWPRSTLVDYQLKIEILRFAGEGLAEAHLEAVWSVMDGEGKCILQPRRVIHRMAADPASYERLVDALNETLALFCREIALEIARLPPTRR